MNQYQTELSELKTWDTIQGTYKIPNANYDFINTAGHGYLVVPKTDRDADIAKKICKYGFVGKLAYYLEEDCEAWEFLRKKERRETRIENASWKNI